MKPAIAAESIDPVDARNALIYSLKLMKYLSEYKNITFNLAIESLEKVLEGRAPSDALAMITRND